MTPAAKQVKVHRLLVEDGANLITNIYNRTFKCGGNTCPIKFSVIPLSLSSQQNSLFSEKYLTCGTQFLSPLLYGFSLKIAYFTLSLSLSPNCSQYVSLSSSKLKYTLSPITKPLNLSFSQLFPIWIIISLTPFPSIFSLRSLSIRFIRTIINRLVNFLPLIFTVIFSHNSFSC